MRIGIYSVFGHMECIGFLLELLKQHTVTVCIATKTDNYNWLEYFKKFYTFEVNYNTDTTHTFEKIIRLTSNDSCLQTTNSISLVHIESLKAIENISEYYISLTPYIHGNNIYYMFPIFTPSICKERYNTITLLGYYKNSDIDDDTSLFISSNPEYTFQFIVWGDWNYTNLTKHSNVIFLNNIQTLPMIYYFQSSKFILSKKYINYDRFSGQLGLAMSLEIPMIIDSRTANTYGLPGITFEKNYSEVGRLADMKDEQYSSLVKQIQEFNATTLEKNRVQIEELLMKVASP